jgi:hypothetical protein
MKKGRFFIALLIYQTVLSMNKASCSSWDASIEILMKHLPSNWSRISSTHSMMINLINPKWNGSGICGICLNTPKGKWKKCLYLPETILYSDVSPSLMVFLNSDQRMASLV